MESILRHDNAATTAASFAAERGVHSTWQYRNLVQWIRQTPGGMVHDNLYLNDRGTFTGRGIYASATISAGETLITLPASLTISGSPCPSRYENSDGTYDVSNWLRSIAAYFKAHKGDKFTAYLESLPDKYDSLLNWSNHEIKEYLAGTALGNLVLKDRNDNIFETRYREAVRPYLQFLNLVPESEIEQEVEDFRSACMCVSTRGFHLSDMTSKSFSGPFLLPWIDLLNHDPRQKCTTLKWDQKNNVFYMEAERDIAANEELFHSYNNNTSLSSTEMLKTFGFVPTDAIQDAIHARTTETVSPATLTKEEIKVACQTVAESSFPSRLRSHMSKMENENERWEIDNDMTTRELSFLPNEFHITHSEPLSDELVTAFSTLFLPPDVYSEFIREGITLLGKEVLDDFYLGKLVCQAIEQSIAIKCECYASISMPNMDAKDDMTILKEVCTRSGPLHAIYGLTIRLEEKACWKALQLEICRISTSLGGISIDRGEPVMKKPKAL